MDLRKKFINTSGLSEKEIQDFIKKWLPERSDLVAALSKAAQSEIAAAIEVGALRGAIKHGMTPSFDVFNPGVSAWIREYTAKLAGSVADTTLRDLSKTLADGLENGETILQLRDRVGNVIGPEACEYRAEMIAATEVSRAESAGQQEQMKQFGAVRKVWRANPDACEWCQEIDGMTIDIEQVFFEQGTSITITTEDGSEKSASLDYGDTDTPPLHPWCRCDVAYEFE